MPVGHEATSTPAASMRIRKALKPEGTSDLGHVSDFGNPTIKIKDKDLNILNCGVGGIL